MITLSNRTSPHFGELIAAHIGSNLIAFFNAQLQIVNASEIDVQEGGNATASLTDARFDFIVRECMSIIHTRTNENRPRPSAPARLAAPGRRLT